MHPTPLMEKAFWESRSVLEFRFMAWEKEVLFTWEWWIGVILTILPWILWVIFRKKENTLRLFFPGVYVALVASTLDNLGYQLGLWNYLKPFLPTFPSYLPYDFALMPVGVMLFIQFFSKKNPWLIGALFGIVASFVAEPFVSVLRIYDPIHWKTVYSFPIYILIYVTAFRLFNASNRW